MNHIKKIMYVFNIAQRRMLLEMHANVHMSISKKRHLHTKRIQELVPMNQTKIRRETCGNTNQAHNKRKSNNKTMRNMCVLYNVTILGITTFLTFAKFLIFELCTKT